MRPRRPARQNGNSFETSPAGVVTLLHRAKSLIILWQKRIKVLSYADDVNIYLRHASCMRQSRATAWYILKVALNYYFRNTEARAHTYTHTHPESRCVSLRLIKVQRRCQQHKAEAVIGITCHPFAGDRFFRVFAEDGPLNLSLFLSRSSNGGITYLHPASF